MATDCNEYTAKVPESEKLQFRLWDHIEWVRLSRGETAATKLMRIVMQTIDNYEQERRKKQVQ